uniref:Wall-associated receptor kinase 2 n=1 Tax=Anthurium amnicola TaxID=1678845 RepID=A0A1D1XTW4_9ARAE
MPGNVRRQVHAVAGGLDMALQRAPLPLFPLLPFLLLVQLPWLNPISPSTATTHPSPDCPKRCGNVSLPFPFGIGPGCSRDLNFNIYCDDSATPQKPYLFSNHSNIEVLNITLSEGEIRIYKTMAFECYNSSGFRVDNSTGYINLNGSMYRLSDTRNVFTGIGCNLAAFIFGEGKSRYMSGCASSCITEDSVEKGSCFGRGCCQTSISQGLNFYEVLFLTLINQSDIWGFNPCSFAFVAEEGAYTFDPSDLNGTNLIDKFPTGVPMVLDWVVGPESCESAMRNKSSYACVSANSVCSNASNASGYRCNCSTGYEGNPYILHGCQDINECEGSNNCPRNGICKNTPGNYTCSCPKGTKLDSATNECQKKKFAASTLALGLSIGLVLCVILGSWIYCGLQRRKAMISRQIFFEQNGGLLLKQQISSGNRGTFKIYTIEEIERATNKFDKQMILGQGGEGTVYRGTLDDDRVVAIKKPRIIEESHRDGFAREMLILSQINHKNVVKLLGCCLEADIPMLVSEFISNGTLFHYLHREKHRSPISFAERIRIATEAAEALNYLHAEADPPIVHGDVKSANMLLDDKYMVKISDFGASKLTPMDKAQFVTLVQGTYGYLDPESLQTQQLTTKSDVYSFGVILAELLTGKMALYSEGCEQQKSLALNFVLAVKDNTLLMIIDAEICNEEHIELLYDVARLASRCLSTRGEERPSMKEVAKELEGIRSILLAQGAPYMVNETEPLLERPNNYENITSTYFDTTNDLLEMGGR